MAQQLSREIEIIPQEAALLFVDVQNYNATAAGAEFAAMMPEHVQREYGWFFETLRNDAVPNMRRLQAACRKAHIEVLYTVIENATLDGRDRSLDYKVSGLNVPKGSWDAKVIDELRPAGDEIVLGKTSSSVFISTNIHYILGNLGTRFLMIAGCLTDQCVDSAVRDACDLGYLVTTVTDACATLSQERHDWSLRLTKGYARQRTTAQVVEEIERLTARTSQRSGEILFPGT
jgi:ureidoacrylate peracid hydrolase